MVLNEPISAIRLTNAEFIVVLSMVGASVDAQLFTERPAQPISGIQWRTAVHSLVRRGLIRLDQTSIHISETLARSLDVCKEFRVEVGLTFSGVVPIKALILSNSLRNVLIRSTEQTSLDLVLFPDGTSLTRAVSSTVKWVDFSTVNEFRLAGVAVREGGQIVIHAGPFDGKTDFDQFTFPELAR
jgi:hypothetical protein